MKTLVRFIFLLPCLFAACMEDRGNYDYSEINEMMIDTLRNQTVQIADTLRIESKVYCSQDNGDLQYCWYRYVGNEENGLKVDTLSLEQNLEMKMDFSTGKYEIYLRVTDLNTGISAKNSCTVTVVGQFANGLMVLGEVDGVPNFVFLNDAEVLTEVYGPENGDKLGSHPVCVGNAVSDLTRQILVLCDDDRGGVVLSSNDFSVVAEYGDLFTLAPSVIKPQAYHKGVMYGEEVAADFIISDGKIHTRDFRRDATRFLPYIEGDYEFAPWVIGNGYYNLFYDNKNGRFLTIWGSSSWLNPYFSTIEYYYGYNPSVMDLELVYMAEATPDAWKQKRGFGIFRNSQNELLGLDFTVDLSTNTPEWGHYMDFYIENKITADATGIDEATGYAMSLAKPYLYYSKDSKIYRYEWENNICFPVYDTDTIPGLENSTIDKIYMEYKPWWDGAGDTSLPYNTTLYVSSSQDTPGRNGTLHILELDANNGTVKSRKALYKNVCGKTVSMQMK